MPDAQPPEFSRVVIALNGGSSPNQYNSWADFLLGIPSAISKVLPWEQITTRAWFYRLYIRDQGIVNAYDIRAR